MRALFRRLPRMIIRLLLILSAGLAILLASTWAAFPWIAPPVLERALAGSGMRLAALETERPGFTQLRAATLSLASPTTTVTLRDIRVQFTPAWYAGGDGLPGLAGGALDLVEVARLEAEYRTPDEPAAAGPPASAVPDPGAWLPSALRARLPVRHVRIPAARLQLRMPAQVRIDGSLRVDPDQIRLQATLAGAPLEAPLDLELELDTDDRVRVLLSGPSDVTVAEGSARIRVDGARTELRGRARFDAAALGALPGLNVPDIAGLVAMALIREGNRLTLDLLPSTLIELRIPLASARAESQVATVRLEPESAFSLALEEDALSSSGALPLKVHSPPPRNLEGTLTLSDIGANLTDERIRPRAHLEGRGRLQMATGSEIGNLAGHWTLSGNLALDDSGRLRIEPGATVTLPRLGAGAEPGGWSLARTSLETTTALRLEPMGPKLAPVTARLHVGRLGIGDRHTDLSGHRATLRAQADADGAHLEVEVDGPDLSVQAQVRRETASGRIHADLAQLRADLGPETLAGRLLAPMLPATFPDGWPVHTGRLTADGRLAWPLAEASGSRANLALEGIAIAGRGVDLEGLEASAAWQGGSHRGRLEDIDVNARTAAYLPAPTSTSWRAGDLSLTGSLEVNAPAGVTLGAARAAATLAVRELDATIGQLRIPGASAGALRLTGSGIRTADDRRGRVRITADALAAGVTLTDLACVIDLTGTHITLEQCETSLLGGQASAPRGRYDLATGTGYVPLALQGLDLGAALKLMQDPSLTGTGTLDGAVPLRLGRDPDGTVVTITDGYLAARPPGGRIRYAPDASLAQRVTQPGLSLALSALEDFRYEQLRTAVDYAADGTLTLGVRLAGANPEVQKGRPINFNLEVSQNLLRLLQSLRLSRNIGDTLEHRLQERLAPDDDTDP